MTWIRPAAFPLPTTAPARTAGLIEVAIPDGDGQIVVDTAGSPSTY